MGLLADGRAYLIQRSAAATVRYGESLSFEGRDLPAPEVIRVPTRRGWVSVHVYRPPGVERPPVYVHAHGGAFVMRFPQMDDFFCRHVAAVCGAVVLNVDYDVAPQVRYPVAHEQLHDVAYWASGHGRDLAVDGTRVAIGGFSAGGNLAAAAALEARDEGTFSPRLQLLGVPALDVASAVTRDASTSGSMVTPRLQRLVRKTYFRDRSRRGEPYASPVLAPDLAGVAPAVVVTAGRDALREAGDRYARRLAAAGVPVTHHVVPEADHYFLDGNRTRARMTLDVLTDSLDSAFGRTVEHTE